MRANAARYGIDPRFHRGADIHVHVQSRAARKEGASAGVAMVAAMVSALTGRVVRGDLAMTGEITLSGQVLPAGGIKEKVLAAHRYSLTRVVLPQQNKRQVEELGDDLRRAVSAHYVTRLDELLDLAVQPSRQAARGVRSRRPAGRPDLRRVPRPARPRPYVARHPRPTEGETDSRSSSAGGAAG